jgi:hypothetical protein
MDWVGWVSVMVLVAVVAPPAIAPISVRRQVWKARQPRFDRLPRVSLPEEVARQVTPQADRLQALGFELVGYAVRTDQCGGAIAHLALLVDRAEGHLAAVESVALGEVRRTYVEFCSELADSVELNTSNGDGVGCEPSHPGARSYAFPGLRDLERLYRLHRRLVQQAAHGRPSRRPAAGAEFDELVRGMERENARQASSGYWYLDASDARYRPTWKGAVLMTWKLTWPIGTLRRLLRRLQAAGLRRRLEAA